MTFFVNQNSAGTMVQLNLVKPWNLRLKFAVLYLTASKTSSFDHALISCEINNYDNLFISQNVSPVIYDKTDTSHCLENSRAVSVLHYSDAQIVNVQKQKEELIE